MRTHVGCFPSISKAAFFAAIIGFAISLSFPANVTFAAESRVIVTAANPLEIARSNETIALSWKEIAALLPAARPDAIAVTDDATKNKLVSQAVDMDGDGAADDFLFQSDFQPNETKRFILTPSAATSSSTQSTSSTKSTASPPQAPSGSGSSSGAASGPRSKVFARFAPDKLDDFAWENDRIAFRLYGPAKQKLALRGSEEGAISCGVDVWAKRTRSLIINKWYSRGNYSYDSGEGLDFYSVGSGLGCGASGVWAAGKLWHARNFSKQKLIANGPVRAVFELTYPSYNAGATTVTETRRISLDAGSNLSRFEVTFNTVPPTTSALTCVAGIARHRGMDFTTNPSKAWLATWETQYGSSGAFLGCGIVLNPNLLVRFAEDYAHHYTVAKAETGKPFVYYAGAGWTRSGDFEDYEPWKAYLNQFARRLLEPVKVKIALE